MSKNYSKSSSWFWLSITPWSPAREAAWKNDMEEENESRTRTGLVGIIGTTAVERCVFSSIWPSNLGARLLPCSPQRTENYCERWSQRYSYDAGRRSCDKSPADFPPKPFDVQKKAPEVKMLPALHCMELFWADICTRKIHLSETFFESRITKHKSYDPRTKQKCVPAADEIAVGFFSHVTTATSLAGGKTIRKMSCTTWRRTLSAASSCIYPTSNYTYRIKRSKHEIQSAPNLSLRFAPWHHCPLFRLLRTGCLNRRGPSECQRRSTRTLESVGITNTVGTPDSNNKHCFQSLLAPFQIGYLLFLSSDCIDLKDIRVPELMPDISSCLRIPRCPCSRDFSLTRGGTRMPSVTCRCGRTGFHITYLVTINVLSLRRSARCTGECGENLVVPNPSISCRRRIKEVLQSPPTCLPPFT